MMTFISTFPSKENEKDGMMQRVRHVDELLMDMKRNYLDISFRRNFIRKVHHTGSASVYKLNFFIHIFTIYRILSQSKLVYIHSAYNAIKLLIFPVRGYRVFDVHGIVPEELAQEKKWLHSLLYSIVEAVMIKKSDALIFVSNSMAGHFKRKYSKIIRSEQLVIPILPRVEESSKELVLKATRDPRSVIYAGGTQVWQNINKMTNAALRQPTFSYTFLSSSPEQFLSQFKDQAPAHLSCRSVPADEVKKFYLAHQYGFILRNQDLVNAVACPTKLVEYLAWGVIPITITDNIGDFDGSNISSVNLRDFEEGLLPDPSTVDQMRRKNFASVSSHIETAKTEETRLKILIQLNVL